MFPLDLGFDELAAKSRTLIMIALSSAEFDSEMTQPSIQERWALIRELFLPPLSVDHCRRMARFCS